MFEFVVDSGPHRHLVTPELGRSRVASAAVKRDSACGSVRSRSSLHQVLSRSRAVPPGAVSSLKEVVHERVDLVAGEAQLRHASRRSTLARPKAGRDEYARGGDGLCQIVLGTQVRPPVTRPRWRIGQRGKPGPDRCGRVWTDMATRAALGKEQSCSVGLDPRHRRSAGLIPCRHTDHSQDGSAGGGPPAERTHGCVAGSFRRARNTSHAATAASAPASPNVARRAIAQVHVPESSPLLAEATSRVPTS